MVMLLLPLGADGLPAPAVLAHACCCAPCAHALPPILCSPRVWTRRQLMLTLSLLSGLVGATLSSQPAGATLARCRRAHGEAEGSLWGHASLLWMSPPSCSSCSLAHSGLQLALAAPLTRAHPGLTACSVLAHTWLTLKSSPRVIVAAAAAAPDTSSRSGAGQAGRDGSFCHWFPCGQRSAAAAVPVPPLPGPPAGHGLFAPRAAPIRPELCLAPASSSSRSPPVLSSPPLCSGPCHCRGGLRGGPLAGGGARPSPLPPAARSGCAHPASRVRVLSITCQTLYSFNICRYVPLFPTFHQQKGLSNSFQIRRSRWLHGTSVPILSLFIASPGPDKGWALGLI